MVLAVCCSVVATVARGVWAPLVSDLVQCWVRHVVCCCRIVDLGVLCFVSCTYKFVSPCLVSVTI